MIFFWIKKRLWSLNLIITFFAFPEVFANSEVFDIPEVFDFPVVFDFPEVSALHSFTHSCPRGRLLRGALGWRPHWLLYGRWRVAAAVLRQLLPQPLGRTAPHLALLLAVLSLFLLALRRRHLRRVLFSPLRPSVLEPHLKQDDSSYSLCKIDYVLLPS